MGGKRWSSEELIIIENSYSNLKTKDLQKLLPNRSCANIQDKAFKLRLKREDSRNVKFLLEEKLESFYWIGFLLADGWFGENALNVSASINDSEHIKKLANVLNVNSYSYPAKPKSFSKIGHIDIHVNDVVNVKLIKQKFDIKTKKTYNPPDFARYKFNNDQIISLIIGFIDGDGSISKRKYGYNISIQIHKSWKENLKFINNFIQIYFGCKSENDICFNTRDKNTVSLYITKNRIINALNAFAKNHCLPVLSRKWSKISSNGVQ